jgi:hypothetical protein
VSIEQLDADERVSRSACAYKLASHIYIVNILVYIPYARTRRALCR